MKKVLTGVIDLDDLNIIAVGTGYVYDPQQTDFDDSLSAITDYDLTEDGITTKALGTATVNATASGVTITYGNATWTGVSETEIQGFVIYATPESPVPVFYVPMDQDFDGGTLTIKFTNGIVEIT